MSVPEVRVLPDAAALSRAGAEEVLRVARESNLQAGRFTLALAGGRTPRQTYEALARCPRTGPEAASWETWEIFFGDERPVPPDHPDSNFRMAQETLLDDGRIPSARVHRIAGEREPAQAAELYEAELRRFFGEAHGRPPRFDLVLLGLGTDGHTASLFPGTSAVTEARRWVCAPWVPRLQSHRITLTLPVLNAAGAVLFLVSGAEKAGVVRTVLEGRNDLEPLPARRVRPHAGRLLWLVDAAAARELPASWLSLGREASKEPPARQP